MQPMLHSTSGPHMLPSPQSQSQSQLQQGCITKAVRLPLCPQRRRLLRRLKCSGRGIHFSCGIESKTTTAKAAAAEKFFASELKMQRIEFATRWQHAHLAATPTPASPPPKYISQQIMMHLKNVFSSVCVCVCSRGSDRGRGSGSGSNRKSLRASFHVQEAE